MTLVNKSIRFYTLSSVYCTVCSPPQVKSPYITIYPPLPPSTTPHSTTLLSGNCHTVVHGVFRNIYSSWVFLYFSSFNPFTLLTQPLSPSPLTAVTLFSVSVSLSPLCLFPHIEWNYTIFICFHFVISLKSKCFLDQNRLKNA